MKEYDFNEKTTEYSSKQRKEIPVWVSPKYTQSREKAIEIIEKYESIESGDFWILMNETKSGKMAYTGLIISHNGCLKLNDAMPEELRFKPSCMTLDKDGFNGSLVFTYINDDQGLYEVGEVSKENCKNSYPYAMALKRCFDRVVLKNSKLAYSGVYSDSEADEFTERLEERNEEAMKSASKRKVKESPKKSAEELAEMKPDDMITAGGADYLLNLAIETKANIDELFKYYGVKEFNQLTKKQYEHCMNILEKRAKERGI